MIKRIVFVLCLVYLCKGTARADEGGDYDCECSPPFSTGPNGQTRTQCRCTKIQGGDGGYVDNGNSANIESGKGKGPGPVLANNDASAPGRGLHLVWPKIHPFYQKTAAYVACTKRKGIVGSTETPPPYFWAKNESGRGVQVAGEWVNYKCDQLGEIDAFQVDAADYFRAVEACYNTANSSHVVSLDDLSNSKYLAQPSEFEGQFSGLYPFMVGANFNFTPFYPDNRAPYQIKEGRAGDFGCGTTGPAAGPPPSSAGNGLVPAGFQAYTETTAYVACTERHGIVGSTETLPEYFQAKDEDGKGVQVIGEWETWKCEKIGAEIGVFAMNASEYIKAVKGCYVTANASYAVTPEDFDKPKYLIKPSEFPDKFSGPYSFITDKGFLPFYPQNSAPYQIKEGAPADLDCIPFGRSDS